MKISSSKMLALSTAFLLVALATGCSGNRDPILGGGGNINPPPTVISTTPVNNATGVPVNTTAITATFSEPMAPITGGATFTLVGAGIGTTPTGTVALDATNRIATFTFTAGTTLAPSTVFTATITGARSLATGVAMVSPYVWRFTTGAAPDIIRPRVTLTVPLTTIPGPTTAVPINTAITAAFTEDMAPATLTGTSFLLTGPGVTPVTGVVTYASRIATFTPSAVLLSNTTYTATITVAARDLAGNALAGNQAALPASSNYVWTFTTSLAPDTTRPRVTLTVPVTTTPGPTTNVATNTAISAAFTEDMAPATFTVASFTLTGPGVTPVAGGVTYASRVVVFTPLALLAANTTYTATVTMAVTDLAGNALAGNQAALPAASNYVWTFTTAVPLDVTPPTVILTNPLNLATNVALNTTVNATFSEAMDPLTVTLATFTLQASGPPLGAALLGSVVYNPLTFMATFTPSAPLTPSTSYTATVVGAKDLAGNNLAPGLVPNPWTFTTGTGVAPGTIVLGSAGAFGIMATSAITNTGAATMINGDVSLDPGTSCGLLPVQVNGTIHVNDTVSAQARADLLVAYNFGKNLPPGVTISGGADLGALYPVGIPPGTYTSGSTMLVSTPLVLDAGGNANAVWVFQIGSSLTTGASVSLANGAQAKNVFWVPTLDGTIGVGTIFYGTVISGRNVTCQTGAVINGRILAGATLAGTIALDTNTVNVPAP